MNWIINLLGAFMPLVEAYVVPCFCILAVVYLFWLAASLFWR